MPKYNRRFNKKNSIGVPVTFPDITIGEGIWPQIFATLAANVKLQANLKDFREPLNRSLREVIIPSIKKNFEMEGRPPWQQLAISTVEIRKTAHPILRVTGRLRRKATQLNMWRVTKDQLYSPIGPIVSYAAFHQAGTGRMPARPFVMYQPEDIEKIEEIFSRWFDGKVQSWAGR